MTKKLFKKKIEDKNDEFVSIYFLSKRDLAKLLKILLTKMM